MSDRFHSWVVNKQLAQPFFAPYWHGREFQLCARDQIIRSRRCILSMDKGLGKTSTVLSLFEDPLIHLDVPGFTVIIFTTKRGMLAYERDIQMFPEHQHKLCLVKGSQGQRRALWRNPTAKYFIVTYNTFLADTGSRMQSRARGEASESIVPSWVTDNQVDAVICDEFHRVFRNRHSATFELFKRLFKRTKYFIPMSGSAVSKGPEDLWPALHLCDQRFWSTYWGYVNTWCEIMGDGAYKKVSGPKQKEWGGIDQERVLKWRAAVAPYVFHVTAEDVQDEIPEINNYPLDIELEPWQRHLHDSLLKDQYAELPSGEFLLSSNRLSNLFKIRTALICPKALSPELGVGSGIEGIIDDVEDGEIFRYAIFTPFRAPIPHLAEYIEGRGHKVIILQGGLTEDALASLLETWRRDNPKDSGRPICILATVKYSESWEIPEASYCYFLGYEWDNEDNDQARKRLRRLISPRPVMAQWVRHQGTYDEEFLTELMRKNDSKKAMMDTWNE